MKTTLKSSSEDDNIELMLTSEAAVLLTRTIALATELKGIPGMIVKFQIIIEADQSLLSNAVLKESKKH